MSANPLTIEAFAKWARAQPPERTYNFWDDARCAGGLYAKSLGMDSIGDLPPQLERAINFYACGSYPSEGSRRRMNFGDLQKRLAEGVPPFG